MVIYTSYTDALGVTHKDEAVATYDNGKVYLAVDGFLGTVGKGRVIAEYENGRIYSVSHHLNKREYLIGIYENGVIYGVYNTITGGVGKSLPIGECYCGNIYSKKDGIVGKYDGDVDGAAAAAAVLIFCLTSDVSATKGEINLIDSDNERKEMPENAAVGGVGCSPVGAIFGLFIICLLGLILYEYKEYMSLLFYVAIPMVLLLISVLKKRKVLQNKGIKFTKLSVKGILQSLALSFLYVLFTIGIFMHKIASVQIVDVDFGILLVFVINIITAIVSSQE